MPDWQENMKPKNSLQDAGMLILFKSFLLQSASWFRILLLDPSFSFHHIVAQVHASIWHFENSSLLLWDTLKKVICLIRSYDVPTFSFVMPFSHQSEHTKLLTSLIINLWMAVFYEQLLPWEGLNKPQGDPDSSSSGHFSLCPLRPVSSASFVCKAFSSIFFVVLRPRQSLWTVCFWVFALSAAWPVLHIALLCPPWPVSSASFFCKAFYSMEKEHLVIIAPPPPPELRLHKSSLRTSGQQKKRYALRTSILRMFLDHQVKPPNLTEMMCHRGIRIENCLCSICRSIEGLMHLGKDWALMLLPCLILSPKVFDEDWIRRLPNQDHRCPLCVQCVGFRIQY